MGRAFNHGEFCFPKGHIFGLTLSTAGSSATFSVATGEAVDSTQAALCTLSSSFSKTTGSWVAGSGNGALDTGSITTSTWYHVFIISNGTASTVDILISLSATAPTMPTNYTLFRRIGSMKTNGSSQWTKFIQFGDDFSWDVGVGDLQNAAFSTTAATVTLTVPTGIQVVAWLVYYIGTGGVNGLLTPLDISDSATSGADFTITTGAVSSADSGSTWATIRTNTSAQIRRRESTSGASGTYLITHGWTDTRGRLL